MENLPIDIHSNKLLDWLISRRHCPRNWQDSVDAIRPKISHAIQDMPENEQIVAILSGGQYINYFHCKQILAILHDTEKDTKNMFGFYSSQRVKDWKEIISLYERENVYLGEAANFLQRFVQYEVPAIRRQIAKAENTNRESARKEQDYARQATENRRAFERELTKWGLTAVQGGDLRRSLLAQADGQSPAQLPILPELAKALAYFEHFSEYIGQDTTDMFPLIRLLASANAAGRPVDEVTVYEWKHGRVPEAVIPQARLHFSAEAEPTKEEDEIDFGDDDGTEADIDFCTNGGADSSASGDGIQIVSVEEGDHLATTISEPTSTSGVDGIARGQDAIPVLDHPTALGHFLDELEQLMAFLHFRQEDEEADNVAGIYLAGLAQKPVELMREGDQVPGWLEAFKRTATELGDPQRLQLLRIRSSQSFVDEIVSQLEHKRRLEFKYRQMERLANERQQKCVQEMRGADHLLARLIEAAKQLQENLEADISKRYNGREVYIMGEINAVLYGS